MNPSIFLVDDDEDDRFILNLAFSEIGLSETVVIFSSGNALLKRVEKLSPPQYPNLIGTDWQMPELSGEELLVILKKHPQLLSIPVVVFSHNMTTKSSQRLMGLGALACFEKATLFSTYKEMAQRLVAMAGHDIVGIEINQY
jgi:CheY-like chemotaxis protein